MYLNLRSFDVVSFVTLCACMATRIMAACVAVFLVVSVSGCVSGSKTADVNPVSAVLPTAGDYSVPDVADFNVDLTLSNEVINSRLMTQQELPQVTFTVWGFDELAADVSATKIKVSSFALRPQAVPYHLRFSETELQSIEYQSGSTESMKYYITMGVDVDGDGQICNGDLRQDYALSQPERFPVTETQVVREIKVSEVFGEICSS